MDVGTSGGVWGLERGSLYFPFLMSDLPSRNNFRQRVTPSGSLLHCLR